MTALQGMNMTLWKTSCKSVVEDNKDDEDGVVDGESDKKFIESVFHLTCRENKDRKNVSKESESSNKRLQNHNYKSKIS